MEFVSSQGNFHATSKSVRSQGVLLIRLFIYLFISLPTMFDKVIFRFWQNIVITKNLISILKAIDLCGFTTKRFMTRKAVFIVNVYLATPS